MKNITLAIDDDVLDRVRVIAAEERTTVNALVRDFLVRKVAQSTSTERRAEARQRMRELSEESSGAIPADWKFDREGTYAGRISRHERADLRGSRKKK